MDDSGEDISRATTAASIWWDISFGATAICFALLALFVWFPNDINGGFMFINAIGREEPGDAFFPTLIVLAIAVLGALQIIASLRDRMAGRRSVALGLSLSNVRFLAEFLLIVGVGLTVMYWLGPAVVLVLNAVGFLEGSYRNYTDTAPLKYVGFVVGGVVLALGLIRRTEGRIRWASILSVACVLLFSILVFDTFLNNVLLPPNAEF